MPKGIKGFIKGSPSWNKNKKMSEAFKAKLSKIQKENGTGRWMHQKKGPKNNCWNGGTEKWWKIKAKVRDDYTCQICGLREVEIMEVDHIKPKGRYPEFAKELNNLVTLCPNCHKRKTIREHKQQLDKPIKLT